MSEPTNAEPGERVIADPLRFKQRLKIGREAFRTLQAKDSLQDFWNAAGVGTAGAAVASSTAVATTFFAPTGLMAWLGLATAATPLGWVLAAAVGSMGVYYYVSRGVASDQRFVDEIPKFISTPLDVLGATLFDMVGMLALKVASSDGLIDTRERAAIIDHLVRGWGYDDAFAARRLDELETRQGDVTLKALALHLARFQEANPDCNGPAMQAELLSFVEELVRADGVLSVEEAAALSALRETLARSGTSAASSLLGNARTVLASAAGKFSQSPAQSCVMQTREKPPGPPTR